MEGNLTDQEISNTLNAHTRTVERVRENCVLNGMEAALNRKVRTKNRTKVLDGKAEAQLIQLACSEPPNGFERWSLRMLTEKMIELEYVQSVSQETIRLTLKKMNLSLG